MKIKVVSLIPLRKRQLLRKQVKTTYDKTVDGKVSKDDVKIIIFQKSKRLTLVISKDNFQKLKSKNM